MANMNLGTLKVGMLVRSDGRIWRVGLANPSRARLDPVSGVATVSPVSGRSFQSYGTCANIGVQALVEIVSEDTLTPGEMARVFRLIEQEKVNSMAVAGAPVAGGEVKKSLKEKNEERKATLAASKEAKAAERAAAKAAKVATPKVLNKCKCGCGGDTGGYFIPGHDARFKSWLLKIERGQAKPEELLTAEVRAAYKWKKSANGKGLVPTLNYKGEAHTGYDAGTSEA